MADQDIALKVLLKKRHLHGHAAFCKEYDKAAKRLDKDLVGSHPSKAQYYRWLSGELLGLPYSDHCRVLEIMFPDWTAEQLFAPHVGVLEYTPDANKPPETAPQQAASGTNVPTDFVGLYAHRADVPKDLWLTLLEGAHHSIDLFANASLFLPEDNPDAIDLLRAKANEGVTIRLLLGDPTHDAIKLRGEEERLYDALIGRVQMAHAYYRPLINLDGVQFKVHGTSLYNSIFRYDNQMLVNQHIYGTYGYIAPILHLRRSSDSDLFETYMKSLERVWTDEAYEYAPSQR
ncbi:hypothetical protein L6E12_03335 [Actinokineospora sp. PR83]|uniref:hypothetical protein n=1 Tax=Actinokineospora sp. PR83 TaxID=2884908 RepID=UPI001F457D07|nr:hypothetical protein [Actinokineospora sp. PR83]MCG8914825.1 hypothetical protein [Actinokineospora sp. PR83]